MSDVYLFQVDTAANNDAFFEDMRRGAKLFYRGPGLQVSKARWIPDGVRVDDESPDRCSLTLIELEATEAEALISGRKYLPEDSHTVFDDFNKYVKRVMEECRSTRDSRASALEDLRRTLDGVAVTVKTACALRSSPYRMIEELPFIDQPRLTHSEKVKRDGIRDKGDLGEGEESRSFKGTLRLAAEEVKALGRCVMILDAIIRGDDFSKATFHSWREKAPLKRLLRKEAKKPPVLKQLVLGIQNKGTELSFETLLSELAGIWQNNNGGTFNLERARDLINHYFPVALGIKGQSRMPDIFKTARKCIDAAKANS